MCEFDTDVKTELELSSWWKKIRFLSKSTYQNTQAEQKEGRSRSFCISRNEEL